MGDKAFTVMFPYDTAKRQAELECPRHVPWDLMELHNRQVLLNHGFHQGLAVLNARGGLAPSELVAVLKNRRWMPMPLEQAVAELKQIIAEHVR